MTRVLHVAIREFLATAGTRAFIFGVLVTPAMIALLLWVWPHFVEERAPRLSGQVAVIDPTGAVIPGMRDYLRPERMARRRQEDLARMQDAMPDTLKAASADAATKRRVDDAFQQALGEVPTLEVVPLEASSDLDAAKQSLRARPDPERPAATRYALVVVHPTAIAREAGHAGFGAYDLYVRGTLDDRIVDEIEGALRETIVAERVRRSGLDPTEIEALTTLADVKATAITESGEGRSNEILNRLMPAAFMALLLISVMMSGQYLLTTTVEEKANRVVEVLLSAVSPTELMAGKVLGQLAVGLVVLALYLGLGLMAMFSFAMLGLIDPKLILFLFVFYLLAYVTVASFMAAIGAAVNEMREAQAFMTPLMLVIMIPWMLWMPISRDPNSVFATVLSFTPPVSNFVMMLRMASTNPPPLWQPLLSVVIGAVGAVAAMWLAGKIFRIGLLMYGKPPDFATLVRWARMG